MKVVILCGGKGTRMREETEYKPKPLVEIGGLPILWHIMKIYSHYGFNDFVLCLGYKGNMIKEYFLNFEWFANDFTLHMGEGRGEITHHAHALENWNITFAYTGEETNTGGRLFKARKYIEEDTFLMTYGDGLSDVNVLELIKFHNKKGKIATLTGARPTTRFGVLQTNEEELVATFTEKPQSDGYINGGFYVLNKEIFNYLNDDSVFESDALPRLASDGELTVFKHKGFWQPMDTYKEVEEFNKQWNAGIRPWFIW
jgi:glucose-1-phosphate cytidylyltransferase